MNEENWTIEMDGEDWTFLTQEEYDKEVLRNNMSLEDIIKNLVKETLTEDVVRNIVGAPTLEESITCVCGEKLDECKDSYDHMTSGV